MGHSPANKTRQASFRGLKINIRVLPSPIHHALIVKDNDPWGHHTWLPLVKTGVSRHLSFPMVNSSGPSPWFLLYIKSSIPMISTFRLIMQDVASRTNIDWDHGDEEVKWAATSHVQTVRVIVNPTLTTPTSPPPPRPRPSAPISLFLSIILRRCACLSYANFYEEF